MMEGGCRAGGLGRSNIIMLEGGCRGGCLWKFLRLFVAKFVQSNA